MRIILTRENHDVTIAANGFEALEAIKVQEFDFILMDLHMPGMDGIETSRKIREYEDGKRNTYIIALTATFLPEKGHELFDAGIDNYIAKPFEIKHLRQILSHGLDHRKPTAPKEAPAIVPSLDIKLGIELVGGDEEIYKELLAGFVERLPERFEILHTSLEERKMDTFKIAAHNIKGIAASLGALQLSQNAEKLEKEAAEGYTSAVDDSYRDFVEISRSFQQNVSNYLNDDLLEA